MTDRLQLLAECQKARQVVRHAVEAGFLQPGLAIHDRSSAAADRDREPLLRAPFLAIDFSQAIPAAVFTAEIAREVGKIDQLRRIDLRIGAEADDDIRPSAGVGRHRCLRADVFPADEIDTHRDAGRVGVFLGVGAPEHLIGFDEFGRTQHAKLGPLLQRQVQRRHLRFRYVIGGEAVPRQCGSANRGCADRECVPPRELRHVVIPPRNFVAVGL